VAGPLIGELVRCEPIEARVRSLAVVVDPPGFDDPAGMAEIGDGVLVEAVVAQTTVEAFDGAVLRRLAGRVVDDE